MQPHFEGSCGTCHCASRHPLIHFHSNFLHALSRHPFQGIDNRQRYRHKTLSLIVARRTRAAAVIITTTPTTNNQQPTTNNQQPTTKNQQPTTNNQQPTAEMRHDDSNTATTVTHNSLWNSGRQIATLPERVKNAHRRGARVPSSGSECSATNQAHRHLQIEYILV